MKPMKPKPSSTASPSHIPEGYLGFGRDEGGTQASAHHIRNKMPWTLGAYHWPCQSLIHKPPSSYL